MFRPANHSNRALGSRQWQAMVPREGVPTMTNRFRFCQHWGWRVATATLFLAAASPVRADDWGNFPVPWPAPGSTNQPSSGPTPAGSGVTPPGGTTPPSGSGQPPTTIPPGTDNPPPGGGVPPVGADSPPAVPTPGTPSAPATPEPASAILGLIGASTGLFAWRRKRAI
jgi:hypothetical protein